MKRSWKTRRQVPVTYLNSFSNNLFGTFEVARLDDSVCLSIDLPCNLMVCNKEQNDYQDACDLVESHLDLKLKLKEVRRCQSSLYPPGDTRRVGNGRGECAIE